MDGFETFWRAYPRKVGKLAAKREWDKLKPDAALCEQILSSLAWQCEQWDDPQFIPHPRTWLHQGRYFDEPVEPQRKVMSSAAETVFRVIGGGK